MPPILSMHLAREFRLLDGDEPEKGEWNEKDALVRLEGGRGRGGREMEVLRFALEPAEILERGTMFFKLSWGNPTHKLKFKS